MKTKTIQQTVRFKASPLRVYEMLMDSRKHESLSGERARISKRVGGRFTAWGSHISGFNLVLNPAKKSCRPGGRPDGRLTTTPLIVDLHKVMPHMTRRVATRKSLVLASGIQKRIL
jgi:hypothetical protein